MCPQNQELLYPKCGPKIKSYCPQMWSRASLKKRAPKMGKWNRVRNDDVLKTAFEWGLPYRYVGWQIILFPPRNQVRWQSTCLCSAIRSRHRNHETQHQGWLIYLSFSVFATTYSSVTLGKPRQENIWIDVIQHILEKSISQKRATARRFNEARSFICSFSRCY